VHAAEFLEVADPLHALALAVEEVEEAEFLG
jgi:hypothetical protein